MTQSIHVHRVEVGSDGSGRRLNVGVCGHLPHGFVKRLGPAMYDVISKQYGDQSVQVMPNLRRGTSENFLHQ